MLAAKLFVKMPKPPYNVTNVVSDEENQQEEEVQANNGHTFPMYSIAESYARNIRDTVQYVHEEEIPELNLDGDGSDGDNHDEKNNGVAANDVLPFH
jgi:hypothetical protein